MNNRGKHLNKQGGGLATIEGGKYTQADIEEAQMIIQGCRDDLLAYSVRMKEDYDVQRFHEVIAEALMEVASGKIKRLAIEMPPRSGKSKLACINFPSRVLGHNPNLKIVVAGYGKELPNEFSIEAREMVKSDKYKAVFPTVLETEKIDHRRTYSKENQDRDPDQSGYYHSTGIGGGLTGYGGDILIVDDPVKNRDEAESMVYRDKVRNRYTSTLSTRFSNDQSAIIVIMTRWHTDDLRGRIEKLSEQYVKAGIDPEPWTLISIPSLARKQEIPSYHPVEVEKRESFRPNRFSVNYLLQKQIDIGVRDFAALYQQDPITSTGAIFKVEDLRYVKLSDFETVGNKTVQLYRKEHFEVFVFVDPAFSSNKESCDASVGILGKHKMTKELVLFDAYAGTSAPSITIDYLFSMASKRRRRGFEVNTISIEYVTLSKDQTNFFETVEEEMNKRGEFYKMYKWVPKGDKNDRIQFSLEPLISNHKLFLMDDQIPYEQAQKILTQLQQFPTGKKVDLIDMLAQGAIVFRDGMIAEDPTLKKMEPRQKFNPMLGKKVEVTGKAHRRVF